MANEKETKIIKVIELLKVAKPLLIGQIAKTLWPNDFNYTTDVSLTNNIRKILDLQVELGNITRGKGHYATNYRGIFEIHDQKITDCIAQLIFTGCSISAHREVSFSNGRRADLVVLISKNGKVLCAIIEIIHTETETYLRDKLHSFRVWETASEELSQLFNTPIPYFTIITHGSDEAMTFENFIEEVKK